MQKMIPIYKWLITRHWRMARLLILSVSVCMLLQTTHAKTLHAQKTTGKHAYSSIEQQGKDKLAFIRASRKFLKNQESGFLNSLYGRYSIDVENRVISYKQCHKISSESVSRKYQCYDCSASFDDLSKSDVATALCFKQPKKQ